MCLFGAIECHRTILKPESRSSDKVPSREILFYYFLFVFAKNHSNFISTSGKLEGSETHPQSKLPEPRGLSVKENSLCTKNTDIVCPQGRQPSREQGWLSHSQQQLGSRTHSVCQAGLTGASSWQGQPSCSQLLLLLWGLQWDGEGLSLCSLPCSCSAGTRCHQPALWYHPTLTSLAASLHPPAPQTPSSLPGLT